MTNENILKEFNIGEFISGRYTGLNPDWKNMLLSMNTAREDERNQIRDECIKAAEYLEGMDGEYEKGQKSVYEAIAEMLNNQ